MNQPYYASKFWYSEIPPLDPLPLFNVFVSSFLGACSLLHQDLSCSNDHSLVRLAAPKSSPDSHSLFQVPREDVNPMSAQFLPFNPHLSARQIICLSILRENRVLRIALKHSRRTHWVVTSNARFLSQQFFFECV